MAQYNACERASTRHNEMPDTPHVGPAGKGLYLPIFSHRVQDMVAGFVAALICTTVLYPIDTLKTRMQLRSTGSDVSGAGSLYRVRPAA